HRRSGLVQRGPRALPRAVGERRQRGGRAVSAARQARRADGGPGENKAMRHRSALFVFSCACVCGLAVSWAQAPDRSHPPQPGPPAALRLPAIQKQKLSNGLPVWIVELHKVPVTQINIVSFSGTANDPPGKYGLASLTAAMLEEGAGSRSALELADAVDYLGADLGATAGSDASAARLHVPVGRLA